MGKRLFLIVVLLLVGYFAVLQLEHWMPKKPNHNNEKDPVQEKAPQVEYESIKVEKAQVYYGNLLLVNKEYPVRKEAIKSDIIQLSQYEELLQGYRLQDDTIKVSESIIQKFVEMVQAAQKDNVTSFIINSGFRSFEEQQQLHNEMEPGLAMPPGFSEHNLGLALDIGSTLMKMERAPEGKWLKNNSWKFGFILRYPEDKTEITGTMYEPWHYRYVGLPHSAVMKQNNFSLEEYLAYLREQQQVEVTIEGKTYEIHYYPISEETSIEVPTNKYYQISGDNVGGVIVTSSSDKLEE
ncbi:D-Ala-D-Ala carboxypeptidase VanY [Paenibacillus montaniterrae]|uniref:D-Ala-D-Ala carboxypeptidase VanY n=1 Tax=Paenibacillus montaniterrae TaxID=429341 RepID=A0A920CXZ9_9BACL|nr:M15 family metallopeptidase [Paenibacillus montaniterrae]GIP15833.1 D-Ala-D-Ala carboxypeptidase VanY [Paenibacillus montaniterrae]